MPHTQQCHLTISSLSASPVVTQFNEISLVTRGVWVYFIISSRETALKGADELEEKNTPSSPIRVGVSSCLVGQKVRYNGADKRNTYIVDVLSNYFEWVPVCPEVELGLGVPRDTLRLVQSAQDTTQTQLIVTKTGEDLTEQMETYAIKRMEKPDFQSIYGYILKKGSPSCGLEKVKRYVDEDTSEKNGRGLFAEQLVKRFPLLPIGEEDMLSDPALRSNWIERVFAYHRLMQWIIAQPTKKERIHFHTCHKMQLLSHHRGMYTQLGQLVARVEETTDWIEEYAELFMKTLVFPTTTQKHADVMYHLMGFLKKKISHSDKQELIHTIEAYRLGHKSIEVPITLLEHHYTHHPIPWVVDQTYLNLTIRSNALDL